MEMTKLDETIALMIAQNSDRKEYPNYFAVLEMMEEKGHNPTLIRHPSRTLENHGGSEASPWACVITIDPSLSGYDNRNPFYGKHPEEAIKNALDRIDGKD